MTGVLEGFTTVAIIIAAGFVLAHARLVDLSAQRMLAVLTFYLASPALLLTMLSGSKPAELFSGNLVATGGAVAVSGAIAALVARIRGWDLGHAVIAAMCSLYVNAANLGIPIAVYVLGDATLVVPTLLLQLVVLQPLALTLLDVATAEGAVSWRSALARPLKNPMTIGSAVGLVMAITGWRLPQVVADPVSIIGGMSVPAMLIAYGISLRLGPLPGRGVPLAELGLTVGLKMVVQPIAAYLIGRFLLGFEGADLLAVTVLSGLPTAQNVFVMAVRYRRSETLARDAIFVNTFGSIPAMLVISALLT